MEWGPSCIGYFAADVGYKSLADITCGPRKVRQAPIADMDLELSLVGLGQEVVVFHRIGEGLTQRGQTIGRDIRRRKYR